MKLLNKIIYRDDCAMRKGYMQISLAHELKENLKRGFTGSESAMQGIDEACGHMAQCRARKIVADECAACETGNPYSFECNLLTTAEELAK